MIVARWKGMGSVYYLKNACKGESVCTMRSRPLGPRLVESRISLKACMVDGL